MESKKIVFVVEDFPYQGQNGYSTYNRAFLDNFVATGNKVTVIVTGPRLPGIIFSQSSYISGNKPSYCYIHAKSWGSYFFPSTFPSILRGLFASLPRFLKVAVKETKLFKLGKSDIDSSRKKIVKIGRFISSHEAKFTATLIDRISPDVIFVDTLFRANFIHHLQRSYNLALIAHDVFYSRCKSISKQGCLASPDISSNDESNILRKFNHVIAITDEDASLLSAIAPDVGVITLMPPLDLVVKQNNIPKDKRIIYIGSAAHHNVQGLQWFLREVWPSVLNSIPDAQLDIVGSVCDHIDSSSNIVLHGRLDEVSLVAKMARFSINPVLAGSGLKIKVLDYLAHGLPCITTLVGIAGFPHTDPPAIKACADAHSYASGVINWLQRDNDLIASKAIIPDYCSHFSRATFNKKLGILIGQN